MKRKALSSLYDFILTLFTGQILFWKRQSSGEGPVRSAINLILSQLPRRGEVFSDICSGFIKLGGQNFVYTHLKFTGILWYWVPEAEVTRQFEMCNFDFCFKSFHGVNFINVLRNWRHMFVEYSLDQSMLKFSELHFFEWHVYDILVH